MKAKVGDFLVVKGTPTERHDQHADIIEVVAREITTDCSTGSNRWCHS
jgi:hypothetical protein